VATPLADGAAADSSPSTAVVAAPVADSADTAPATVPDASAVAVLPPQARVEETELPSVIINVDADEEEAEQGESLGADTPDGARPASAADAETLPTVGGDGLDIPVTMEPSSPEITVPVDIVEPEFPASGNPLFRRLGERKNVALGGAAVGVLLLVVVLLLALKPTPGALVVSALDADGVPVDDVQVLVDGEERCAKMPCLIEGIESGSHLVRVVAPGDLRAAEQKTEVESGAKTHLSLTLSGSATSARVARTAARAKPAKERVQAEDEESEGEDEGEVTRTISASKAGKKPAAKAPGGKRRSAVERDTSEDRGSGKQKATSGTGSLIVMSRPSGVVSIDGRGVGSSPVTITLSAGPHSVTVRYADGGEHSVSVNVKADKSVSVMLNQ